MAEPKPMASLSSGLLARKGAARPAMRRQGMDGLGTMGGAAMPASPYGLQEDLGWNDMGYDVDPAHEERAPQYGNLLAGAIPDTAPSQPAAESALPPVPVVPDVVRQQAEIAERLAEPAVVAEPAPEAVTEPEPVAHEPVAPEPVPVSEPVAEPVAAPVLAVRQRKRKQAVMEEVVAAAVQSSARRAAFTLRLDSERHLRLRLASAVSGQSAQQLVTAALDELLTKMTEIEELAGRVTRPAAR
ncbi:hypothetical protein C7451_104111 [Blastomonas natatoria]|uniref:Uncharacterized protein n=1 Tax=Blastomonas natatoria TaxID=34015 RepID=A0A2V3V766_9SPHN|nr:hypothetical protein [Blastomonas natatoria]PXW77616.1 hypothetical protein C7451_104111 [Blastomonas natatoria]